MIFNIKPFSIAINEKAMERAKESGMSVTQEKILIRGELCELLDLQDSTMKNYMGGHFLISDAKIQAISDYLNTPFMFQHKSVRKFVLPTKMWESYGK